MSAGGESRAKASPDRGTKAVGVIGDWSFFASERIAADLVLFLETDALGRNVIHCYDYASAVKAKRELCAGLDSERNGSNARKFDAINDAARALADDWRGNANGDVGAENVHGDSCGEG